MAADKTMRDLIDGIEKVRATLTDETRAAAIERLAQRWKARRLMLGAGFAGPTNYAGAADFVVMVRGLSTMGIAGPALVKAATGEDIDGMALGGADVQVDQQGIADLGVASEDEALAAARRFLSY